MDNGITSEGSLLCKYQVLIEVFVKIMEENNTAGIQTIKDGIIMLVSTLMLLRIAFVVQQLSAICFFSALIMMRPNSHSGVAHILTV